MKFYSWFKVNEYKTVLIHQPYFYIWRKKKIDYNRIWTVMIQEFMQNRTVMTIPNGRSSDH